MSGPILKPNADERGFDKELKALQTITVMLMDFDYATRQRMLDYLQNRHHQTPDKANADL